jgi:hypothetical protein
MVPFMKTLLQYFIKNNNFRPQIALLVTMIEKKVI